MKNNINMSISGASRKSFPFLSVFVILILIGYGILVAKSPFPTLKPVKKDMEMPKIDSSAVTWPGYGEAALGAVGYGVLTTNGDKTGRPVASIAKTMLALSVIKEKPLKIGEQGPTYTFTDADVNLYRSNLAVNGSVVPIELNEKLSEYQMLQALLIPSGDNIADTLANWIFGGIDKYLVYANKLASELGMSNSHFSDASGLSPKTVSSASDLLILGEKIMAEPALAEIVNQTKVTLPLAGEVKNYNTLLGTDGIIGIKTGNTDEAGGCLLFAYKKNINGKDITMLGSILGATSRAKVLNDTTNFIESNASSAEFVKVISKGQEIGYYTTPWGEKINIVAKADKEVLVSKGDTIKVELNLDNVSGPMKNGALVGTIKITLNEKIFNIDAIISDNIAAAPIKWKLLHPLK